MFTEYINILVECSKDILIKMANIDIGSVKIRKDEHLKATYSIAHTIQYNDFDETVAISVASAITENLGLTPIKQFDETKEMNNVGNNRNNGPGSKGNGKKGGQMPDLYPAGRGIWHRHPEN